MRYLKTYQVFESDNNLDNIANQFITDMSKIYDLRFGESFDKNKANCAWFTIQFFNWANSKGLDVKVVYFDSDIEAHIAPLINGKVFDFAVKQFTKNPNDNYLILDPEDYQNWGYQSFEIYDELPKLETVFPADKIFLESFNKDTAVMHEKSIYDFFEELKNYRWNDKFPASSIALWSNHFIGEGWFDKVKSHIDRLFDVCQEVDIRHINDAMLEVFDTIPEEKERMVYTSVLYGDYKRIDEPNNRSKFNGTMPLMMSYDDPLAVQKRKNGIILGILIDMINPTLHLPGIKGDTLLRDTRESRFVTDEKWQCQNVKFTDEIFKGRISEWAMKEYKKYSLDNILNLYRAGVVINIGGWGSESRYTGPMDLERLESSIDEVIDLVTADLDYEDILWEYSRGERKFDTSQPIYDYEVKILLKM